VARNHQQRNSLDDNTGRKDADSNLEERSGNGSITLLASNGKVTPGELSSGTRKVKERVKGQKIPGEGKQNKNFGRQD